MYGCKVFLGGRGGAASGKEWYRCFEGLCGAKGKLEYMISLNLAIFLCLALVMGSFLANFAVRWLLGESVMSGRSRCRSCGTALGVGDLVPLVSWVLFRGKCRHCDATISVIYPLMEGAVLLIFLWCLWLLPLEYLGAGCFLGWSLLTLSAIDARCYRLPDVLTLPLIFAGLLFNGWTQPENLMDYVIGAGAGYLLFVVIEVAYQKLRGRAGLGRGDAKLFAAVGAWAGWQSLPEVMFMAAVLGIAAALLWSMGRRQKLVTTRIPFGPFLSVSLWFTWLYGPLIFL